MTRYVHHVYSINVTLVLIYHLDEGIKQSCGLTLLAISQNNSEMMIKFSKKCIPLAFFAIHQQQQQIESTTTSAQSGQAAKQTIWNEVFDEITSGTEYAIRANLAEILELLRAALEHSSWKMRIQAAYALVTVAAKLQSHIEPANLDLMLKMLIAALSSRTWTGKVAKPTNPFENYTKLIRVLIIYVFKEKLLMAVSSIFINCK